MRRVLRGFCRLDHPYLQSCQLAHGSQTVNRSAFFKLTPRTAWPSNAKVFDGTVAMSKRSHDCDALDMQLVFELHTPCAPEDELAIDGLQ